MTAAWPAPGLAHVESPPPPPADSTAAAEGEVAIRVETFGVGNVVRPGDWAGIRLALRDSADHPREVAVRLHLQDSDGDTALLTRTITLNPAREMGTWLYARMPWDIDKGSVVRVSVAEATVGEAGDVQIGRQISRKPIPSGNVADARSSMALVVGTPMLGLDQFAQTLRDHSEPPAAHEVMHVVSGLEPGQLPDHWEGLGAAEVLLWSEGDPAALMGDAPAQAVREWVHRGGHLVVVLPGVGAAWTSPDNPLADLMPTCAIERLPDVDMGPYRVLLAGTVEGASSFKAPLHRFRIKADAPPAEASPIISGPNGTVAVRRIVGSGMVTLIGLDLANPRLARSGWIRADAFWSRILGRRGATPTPTEIEAASKLGGVSRSIGPQVWADEKIPGAISQSREAGVGVLLGLGLFIVYWICAGPLGFYGLRAKGLERHAWVGFVALAGAFTVAAWAGAQWLRPKVEQGWHFTLLDHVYGQPVDRARSFVSVLLPKYGDQRVSLGDPGADVRWRQALTPFSNPEDTSTTAFPDARPYLANVVSMTDLLVPARSTIKTFQADWLGGPRWSMPRPIAPEDEPRVDSTGRLVGRLRHDLPGALERPRVVLVMGQVGEGAVGRTISVSPPPVGRAYAWALPDAWEPGTTLDLATLVPDPQADAKARLAALVPKVGILSSTLPAAIKEEDVDDMIAFYGVLEQPEMGRSPANATTIPAAVHRRLTHTLDLSKWFTQPCLIIIGAVDETPNPVPMFIDGQALDGRDKPSRGRTVLRWVYPLQPSPHIVGGPGAPPRPAAGS